jgi:RNA polymerase sigma-70 factor, ECF subfamily
LLKAVIKRVRAATKGRYNKPVAPPLSRTDGTSDQAVNLDHPERKWIAEYRKGKVESLAPLVEHFRRPLYGFIVRMTESVTDAEDVFQEVWLRAIRHMDSYHEKNFLSWLFRIAHNLVIDRVRRQKPVVHFPETPFTTSSTRWEDRIPDTRNAAPDRQIAMRDVGPRIKAAVAKLPVEQREVFLMRMEGDLPFKEIARIQKVSINTALARMQYALNKLRQELKSDYADLSGIRP